MLKIDHGTPNYSKPSLCLSCRNAHIVRGRRQDECIQFCNVNGEHTRITWPVAECNEVDEKSTPALWQLEKIAWRFSKDDKRKTAGFLDPKSFKQRFGDDD